jgi:hypothetical protein
MTNRDLLSLAVLHHLLISLLAGVRGSASFARAKTFCAFRAIFAAAIAVVGILARG